MVYSNLALNSYHGYFSAAERVGIVYCDFDGSHPLVVMK